MFGALNEDDRNLCQYRRQSGRRFQLWEAVRISYIVVRLPKGIGIRGTRNLDCNRDLPCTDFTPNSSNLERIPLKRLLLCLGLLPAVAYAQPTPQSVRTVYVDPTGVACASPAPLEWYSGTYFGCDGAHYVAFQTGASSGVPSGAIIWIKTGTCPSGYTQEAGFIGLYPLATTAAAGDVGQTGGSTSYTPAGGSAAPTVSSLTAAAQVFTGSGVTSGATSAGTPAGTNTLGGFAEGAISWPAGPPTIAAGVFTQPVIAAGVFTNPTGAWPVSVPTIAAGVFTQPTISWPAGVPAFTGSAGTVPAQVFTGSSATTSAVSGGTPAGTNGASATSGNCAATNIAAGTGSTTACKATAPNLTVTAQTFTGSALSTHTHTLTATGTNATAAFTPAGTIAWPAGVPTNASGAFAEGAIAWPVSVPTNSGGAFTEGAISGGAFAEGAVSWPAGVPTIASGTFTQPTFTGSVLGTHTHSVTAAGTNGTSAVTGTLAAGAFSGTPATIQPPFVKLIPCSKN